ncbi:IS1182 family transposase [Laspinema palackyanum]|uniref:IS1182 family transposase n=1 Tax=Laspinema palackyanum TaxID=3231601 RepID=UPI00345D25C6|nr:IS1182 family transposase [Laspinema sp. D2c]
MTLHPQEQWIIPEQTVAVARAAFPKGNVYMLMYEELGRLYTDQDFIELYPNCGKLAWSPACLALVTLMQFSEGLTDRQAADSVRARIDWKYALGLELTDEGFDHTILKEWRDRLVKKESESILLDKMLARFKEKKLLKGRGIQRTDSTQVLGAIRMLNRLELVGETLRYALNDLSIHAPNWLCSVIQEDWFDRYGSRVDAYRLPKDKSERERLALTIGADGHHLLAAIYEGGTAFDLCELPSVEILRQVWIQQYAFINSELKWRDPKDLKLPPNSIQIESPYDIEARNATKGEKNWTGYQVHLTETCDPDYPHLIVNVETTPATTVDGDMTQVIHEKLLEQELLPHQHLVDSAYVDSHHLVTLRSNYEVDLVGKIRTDSSWQALQQTGFDLSYFKIDWDHQQVSCPVGNISKTWRNRTDKSNQPVIEVHFSKTDCAACQERELCTHSKTNPRLLKLRPREQQEALQAARHRQTTEAFKEDYALRAGCEATISQGVRAFDLRRSRYAGLAKTHLQHIAIATAMNVSRLFEWWTKPNRPLRRPSAFAALKAQYPPLHFF